jgi:hypothetical protein
MRKIILLNQKEKPKKKFHAIKKEKLSKARARFSPVVAVTRDVKGH